MRPEYAAAVAAAAPAEWRSVLEMLFAGRTPVFSTDEGRGARDSLRGFLEGHTRQACVDGASCMALRDRLEERERASMSCVKR